MTNKMRQYLLEKHSAIYTMHTLRPSTERLVQLRLIEQMFEENGDVETARLLKIKRGLNV